MKHKRSIRSGVVFPSRWFERCAGGMYLRQDFSCSYAALAAGDVHMLRQVLLCSSLKSMSWTSALLLRYAARHSNAECLQEVLFVRRVHLEGITQGHLVTPQHLEMAAGRSDPWAAGEAWLNLYRCMQQCNGDVALFAAALE
jgi:hypothetical protein